MELATFFTQFGLSFLIGILGGILAFVTWDFTVDKIAHMRIRTWSKEQALKNRAFATDELMLEADKLMHDENESDAAREFAKRVYIIGRVAESEDK